MSNFQKGQLIKIEFEGREFQVIVIDPNGLGRNQPSVGFGFRLMEKYAGLPEPTLSRWLTRESGVEGDSNNKLQALKLPSGKEYKVIQIVGEDNNQYTVVEATDWFDLAFDVLKNPGKIRKPTREKLLDFLRWFAIKGFYAEVYVALKGDYTEGDSKTISKWLLSRITGTLVRNKYTNFLQAQGCQGYDYANWTNYVYEALFGMDKATMTKTWELIEGDKTIGRNYIPKAEGLDAVAYCENQTIELFYDNLKQAHDDAIQYTLRKFFNGEQAKFEL